MKPQQDLAFSRAEQDAHSALRHLERAAEATQVDGGRWAARIEDGAPSYGTTEWLARRRVAARALQGLAILDENAVDEAERELPRATDGRTTP